MKYTLLVLLTFLCLTSKAQVITAKNITAQPERESPMPWCNDCSAADNKGKVESVQVGYIYTVWNYKQVPAKGFYADTAYHEVEGKGLTDVTYAAFYNAEIVFLTEFIPVKMIYWECRVDTGVLGRLK